MTSNRKSLFGINVYLAIIFGFLAPQQVLAGGKTVLILNSQPGDYIGGGVLQTYKPANGIFNVERMFGGGVVVGFHTPNDSHFWGLSFAPKEGEALAVGQYEGAQRGPFQSPASPGLDVSGDGRGCNTLSGRFLVSEIVLASDDTVQSLAVDFEQHCEGRTPALYGSVRYNSDISLVPRVSVGDAAILKGNAGKSDAAVVIALSMPSNERETVAFATADDTAKWGKDYITRGGRIQFPPGTTAHTVLVPVLGNLEARGNTAFTVKLRKQDTLIGDGLGNVQIYDPNVPMTVITMNSQRGDSIGAGHSWLLSAADTRFMVVRNLHNGVSIDSGRPFDWVLSMAGPDHSMLVPGKYENTQRYPFEPPGLPGLDMSGDGRGCNQSKGQFVVNQADYAGDGSVSNFSADFEQHCDGDNFALFGSVRVNAMLHQASVSNAMIVGSTARFIVTLNPPATATESVKFSTSNDTARAGIDYTAVSTTVTFEPGVVKRTVSVPLLSQAAGKRFFGNLSSTTTPLWIRQGSASF